MKAKLILYVLLAHTDGDLRFLIIIALTARQWQSDSISRAADFFLFFFFCLLLKFRARSAAANTSCLLGQGAWETQSRQQPRHEAGRKCRQNERQDVIERDFAFPSTIVKRQALWCLIQ